MCGNSCVQWHSRVRLSDTHKEPRWSARSSALSEPLDLLGSIGRVEFGVQVKTGISLSTYHVVGYGRIELKVFGPNGSTDVVWTASIGVRKTIFEGKKRYIMRVKRYTIQKYIYQIIISNTTKYLHIVQAKIKRSKIIQ